MDRGVRVGDHDRGADRDLGDPAECEVGDRDRVVARRRAGVIGAGAAGRTAAGDRHLGARYGDLAVGRQPWTVDALDLTELVEAVVVRVDVDHWIDGGVAVERSVKGDHDVGRFAGREQVGTADHGTG